MNFLERSQEYSEMLLHRQNVVTLISIFGVFGLSYAITGTVRGELSEITARKAYAASLNEGSPENPQFMTAGFFADVLVILPARNLDLDRTQRDALMDDILYSNSNADSQNLRDHAADLRFVYLKLADRMEKFTATPIQIEETNQNDDGQSETEASREGDTTAPIYR